MPSTHPSHFEETPREREERRLKERIGILEESVRHLIYRVEELESITKTLRPK